jgi:hypothetical protein
LVSQTRTAQTRTAHGDQSTGNQSDWPKAELKERLPGASPVARWHVKGALGLARPCTHPVKQVGDFSRGGLLSVHRLPPAILRRPDNEGCLRQAALPKQGEHVGPTVADLRQHTRGGRRSHLLNHAQPDVRLALRVLRAMPSLLAPLARRSRDTDNGSLRQAAQRSPTRLAFRAGPPPPFAAGCHLLSIADLPQAGHGSMRGEIQLGGILHQQRYRMALHRSTGVLPMGRQHRRKGHVLLMQQPLQRVDCFPGLLLLGQGSRWIADQGAGSFDRALGAAAIPQMHCPNGLLRPLVGVQQGGCIHIAILRTPSRRNCG